MDQTRQLLDRARALGEALAVHPRVRDLAAAREAVARDAEAQSLLQSYRQQADHIRQLEAQHKPVEVADKHKLAELEARLAGNPALQRLMRCQADYVELMNRVNQEMERPLGRSGAGQDSA